MRPALSLSPIRRVALDLFEIACIALFLAGIAFAAIAIGV